MDRRGYRGSAGVLAWLGYALLLVGWLAATPPFQAPDEVSHYVRTWGLADGQVLGLAPQPPTPPADVANDPARLASFWWAFETTTFVSMPEHLVPQSRDCARNAAEPATCVDLAPETRQDRRNVSTNTGTTSPTSVAAPAALVRLGDSDTEALAWARVGGLLGVLATLGVTLLALAPLGRRVLPGLALGLTPMAVYLGAVLNPSGQEVWLALACLALSWRMLHAGGSRWWVAAAAGPAMLLPLGRQPGAVWALMALGAAILLQPDVVAAVRTRWPALMAWASAYLSGLGLGILWNTRTQVETPVAADNLGGASAELVDRIPMLLRHAVGEFNLFEFPLPRTMTVGWVLLVIVVVAWGAFGPPVPTAATRVAGRLAGPWTVLGTLAFAAAFWVFSYQHTGFDLQGRHLLPGLVLVPVVAIMARPLPLWSGSVMAIAAAGGQAIAWFLTARRFAVGTSGPLVFWTDAAWDPAGGWVPWMVLVTTGIVLLAAAALPSASRNVSPAGAAGRLGRGTPRGRRPAAASASRPAPGRWPAWGSRGAVRSGRSLR